MCRVNQANDDLRTVGRKTEGKGSRCLAPIDGWEYNKRERNVWRLWLGSGTGSG